MDTQASFTPAELPISAVDWHWFDRSLEAGLMAEAHARQRIKCVQGRVSLQNELRWDAHWSGERRQREAAEIYWDGYRAGRS